MRSERFLFCVALIAVAIAQQLLSVKEIFTPGTRYPNTARYAPFLSKSQLGELTSSGKRMHFLLGKLLYQEYWQALSLPNSYNQTFFYIESVDLNATIESAQAHIYGLFDTLQKPTVNNSELAMPFWDPEFSGIVGEVFPKLNYQPAPAHVRKSEASLYASMNANEFMMMSIDICPESDPWYSLNSRTDFYSKKFKPIADEMEKLLAAEMDYGRLRIAKVDELLISARLNRTLGLDVIGILKDEETKAKLEYLSLANMMLTLYFTDYQINASISAEFIELKNQLAATIKGKDFNKFTMKSAHEVHLLGHLIGLRLISPDCIYYKMIANLPAKCQLSGPIEPASSLIYELHKTPAGHVVKVRYNGRYMQLPFCSSPNCPYEEFSRFLNQTIMPNYRAECKFIENYYSKNAKTKKPSTVGYMAALAGISIIIVCYVCFAMYRWRLKRNSNRLLTLKAQSNQPEIEMKERATGGERNEFQSNL